MKKEIKLYKLLPKQEAISILNKKYRLFGGARGGGKSYWLRSEIITQACQCQDLRILVLRRTYPEIYENAIIPLLKELPKELYRYNSTMGIITIIPTNSTIKFSYCRNIQDVLRYQGVEYDVIAIEELTHWTFQEFKLLNASLRTTKPNFKTNFIATTNPGGIGHKRVKRLWIDKQYLDGEYSEEYGFIQSFVYDNDFLIKNNPDYIRNLESLPEIKKKAYLYGDWNVFEGQYFGEWRYNIHICSPYIPEGRKIIALDYGYSAPSSVLWLNKANNGKITCYRELYVTKHTYKQLGEAINGLTQDNEHIEVIIADPSIINKKSDTTGTSFLEETKKILKYKIMGANNSRIDGRNKVRQALQHYTDPNSGLTTAILEVCSNCNNLIRTLPEMIYDKTNVEDLDTSLEDHSCDSLRYGIMYLGVDKLDFSLIQKANSLFLKIGEENNKKRFSKNKNSSILEHRF